MSYHASNLFDEEDSHLAARSMNKDYGPPHPNTLSKDKKGVVKSSQRGPSDPNYDAITDAEEAGYFTQYFNNMPLLPQARPLQFTSHQWTQIHMDQANLRNDVRAIEPAPLYDSFMFMDAPHTGAIGGRAEGRRKQVQDITMQMMGALHDEVPTARERGLGYGGVPKAYMDSQLPPVETFEYAKTARHPGKAK